jgi:Fic family protein
VVNNGDKRETPVKPSDFQKDAPGRVVKSTLGHWTFLPDPLPPEISYSSQLVKFLSNADQALGELKGAGQLLPNPHLLIRPFINRESVLSSKIEGTVSELEDLLRLDVDPDNVNTPDDAIEVRNYVIALDYGLAAIRSGEPFSLKLIREVHRLLLSGVRGEEKRPGLIRDRAVLIGSSLDFGKARFVPPCHTQLDAPLQQFVEFLQSERDMPIVVQLALAHYQFETIHPFNDGNGRVGRLLITLLLCERGILPEPLLYLSAYFEKHRREYYDHLLEVSRRNEWTEWISFVAMGVAEQARDANLRIRKLLKLADEFREQLSKSNRSTQVLRLIDQLFSSPYLTMTMAATALQVHFKTAAVLVEKLVNLGILTELTGQQRNRIFFAPRIMELLVKEFDP